MLYHPASSVKWQKKVPGFHWFSSMKGAEIWAPVELKWLALLKGEEDY